GRAGRAGGGAAAVLRGADPGAAEGLPDARAAASARWRVPELRAVELPGAAPAGRGGGEGHARIEPEPVQCRMVMGWGGAEQQGRWRLRSFRRRAFSLEHADG